MSDRKGNMFMNSQNFSRYFIHYKGWNKNWDEWVPEARMLKFTDDNVEHQKVFLIFLKKCFCHLLSSRRTSVGPTRPKKRAGRDENTFSLCHRFLSLFTSFILITAISQAPSPQPKKEKGRRKCGLKPKKREGKGDEFLLQNGKQVQRRNS